MADASGSNPSPAREQPSSSPSPNEPNPVNQPKLNLLLAEDNLPDALLVREVIRRRELPFDVHVVSDGEKAIDFITRADEQQDAPQPDILLLDLNLPKKDGFEVLTRLRKSPKLATIPVLVITSSDSPADRAQAAELGATYFRKPPSYEEFLKLGDVLRELLQTL